MKTYTKLIHLFLLTIFFVSCESVVPPNKADFETVFEKSEGLETETYESGLDFLARLDRGFEELKVFNYGLTDVGEPLKLAILSPDRVFDAKKSHDNNKIVYFINNGIHPGEPDGIDATLKLFRDLLFSDSLKSKMGNVILVSIPFYNAGGAMNRNSTTRANQAGPNSYGFRGNAQNLDLNRDFIKSDSKNAQTFARIFQNWQPDIFVDTHVSNGADYQYNLTYLATQEDKIGKALGDFLRKDMIPTLQKNMKDAGEEMTPYVNVWGTTPDKGWSQFLDNPRYSTGYASLFNTLSFMTETHMLKPFNKRVDATYKFLDIMLDYANSNHEEIKKARNLATAQNMGQNDFALTWELDSSRVDSINFNGYEPEILDSEVTNGKRSFYNRDKPFSKKVAWAGSFKPKTVVQKPKFYVIPQGWERVITLLKNNEVRMEKLNEDSLIDVMAYKILDFETVSEPYESHYLHSNVKVEKVAKQIKFHRGDCIIPTDQLRVRFIVETLEPQAVDSYFNWNFFDGILQRKEHYSPYVFEDKAKEILANSPELKAKFDAKMEEDETFSKSPKWQLYYIYENSEFSEPSYRIYPVFRIE